MNKEEFDRRMEQEGDSTYHRSIIGIQILNGVWNDLYAGIYAVQAEMREEIDTSHLGIIDTKKLTSLAQERATLHDAFKLVDRLRDEKEEEVYAFREIWVGGIECN